jgi:5-methylcytosine-specific restriction endonuclease McrA
MRRTRSEWEEFERECEKKSRSELADLIWENLHVISETREKHRNQMRTKPIYGGPFGHGGFVVASLHMPDGLDYVSYFVMDQESGFFLSTSDSVTGALAQARWVFSELVEGARLRIECDKFAQASKARKEAADAQRQQQWDERRSELRANPPSSIRSIPKRRKQIFDEAGGKCHYCATPLTLDGKWHIEHKMPKALLGGDEPSNLVASCVSCNHKKKDKTDIEFKAQIGSRKKVPA